MMVRIKRCSDSSCRKVLLHFAGCCCGVTTTATRPVQQQQQLLRWLQFLLLLLWTTTTFQWRNNNNNNNNNNNWGCHSFALLSPPQPRSSRILQHRVPVHSDWVARNSGGVVPPIPPGGMVVVAPPFQPVTTRNTSRNIACRAGRSSSSSSNWSSIPNRHPSHFRSSTKVAQSQLVVRAAAATRDDLEDSDDVMVEDSTSILAREEVVVPEVVSQEDSVVLLRKERKVRRKRIPVGEAAVTEPELQGGTSPVPLVQQRQPAKQSETSVPIPILDVRSLVQGSGFSTKPDSNNKNDNLFSDGNAVTDRRVDTYPETTTRASASTTNNRLVDGTNSQDGDPLAQLLVDVRQMRAEEKNGIQQETESNLSIPKVLSTIVIADFFVVMILFFWFLLGIFSSYVMKDDAIQIAFNGIFQPIVQPALGLLMIASISDAVLKKDDTQQ
jgi:hypothetical protein